MHYEFAFESYHAFKEKTENFDFEFIKNWVAEPEFIEYAENTGSEKTKSICKSIKKAKSSRYAKVTDKQKAAVAHDLLSNNDAKTILVSIYGEKIKNFFIDKTETIGGVEISAKRLAFGYLNTWVCQAGDEAEGHTYRASISAIRHYQDNPEYECYVAEIDGELIAVTESELKSLGQEDHPVKWFSQ